MISKISCSLFGVALLLCLAMLYSCTSDIDSPEKALERIGKEEAAKLSSNEGGEPSSSSVGEGISSSSGGNGEPSSSSDGGGEISSSSGDDGEPSSSSDDGEVSSSSGGDSEPSSSSDEGGISSSSEEQPSSSSEPSSSSVPPPPEFGECNIHEFLYTGEVITDIVSITGDASSCGSITYNSSGSSYTVPNQSGNRSLNITAKAQCGNINLEKTCTKNVVVAPNKQLNAKCESPDGVTNLTISGTTVVEYKCNGYKTDYWITCETAAYTIRVEGEDEIVYGDPNRGNGANLLSLEPIDDRENSGMYLYPKRILITVTGSGSYTCRSW